MSKSKDTVERGIFKEKIHTALYNSNNIKELLIGDTNGMSATQIQNEFKKHVKSHLLIDDTIEDTDSFIFYDIQMPSLKSNIKNCRILMYAICHKDILDDYYNEKYFGNRADALSQMIEEALVIDEKVANSFGIGSLSLDSVDIYNSTRFYGCILIFNVPNFR